LSNQTIWFGRAALPRREGRPQLGAEPRQTPKTLLGGRIVAKKKKAGSKKKASTKKHAKKKGGKKKKK
jgi:hypothetical protein